MKQLSHWASQHTRVAIWTIVVLEVLKNGIGIHLGFRFFPALSATVIEFIAVGLVMAVLILEKNYYHQQQINSLTKAALYRLRVTITFWLFTSSFIISMLLGNRCQHFVSPLSGDFMAQAASSAAEGSETTGNGQANVSSGDVQKTRPLTRRELREERRLMRQKHHQRPSEKSNGEYILLFLLGLGLAILGSGLACNLACSNHGFAAVLVGLLALGALAGGIYFLFKVFRRKSPKPTASSP